MGIINTLIIVFKPVTVKAAGLFGWLSSGPDPATASDLIVFISIVKNIAVGAVGAIAVAMFFWGVFKLFMSGGDQSKVTDARKIILASLIGLSIIIAAQFLITTFLALTY